MLKPDSLRRALTDAVTVLKTSPEMLRIFVDNGSIASTLATSLSFEKRYTLNVIVTDFTGDFSPAHCAVPGVAAGKSARHHDHRRVRKRASRFMQTSTMTAALISASA